jgi:hypothetical protein
VLLAAVAAGPSAVVACANIERPDVPSVMRALVTVSVIRFQYLAQICPESAIPRQ